MEDQTLKNNEILSKGIEKAPELPERIYKLFFKHKGRAPLEKVFRLRGTKRDAIERGQRHCIEMGYQFIIVKPYEVDLDAQERLKKSDPKFFDEAIDSMPAYI